MSRAESTRCCSTIRSPVGSSLDCTRCYGRFLRAVAHVTLCHRAVAAPGAGLMQRLALWGIAIALIGFTFWPLVSSGPVRDASYGPIQAFSDGQSGVANTVMKAHTSR